MSPLFVVAAKYAYDEHLVKPYTEAYLDATRICPEICEFQYDVTLELNVANSTEIIHRPNHGLAHSLRAATYVQLIGEMAKQQCTNTNIKNLLTPKLIKQLSIAAIFMVTGRNSEASFSAGNLCPDLSVEFKNPYGRYLKKSAENFRKFVIGANLHVENSVFGQLYNESEIKMFEDVLENYYNINRSQNLVGEIALTEWLCAHIFTYAHGFDLVRCKPNILRAENFAIPHIVIDDDYNRNFYKKVVISMLDATGDRVYGREDIPAEYQAALFYQSSTDPITCITNINSVVGSKIQDLINENKRPSSTYVPLITNTLVDSTPLPNANQPPNANPSPNTNQPPNANQPPNQPHLMQPDEENMISDRELYRPLLTCDSKFIENMDASKTDTSETYNIPELIKKYVFRPIHRNIIIYNTDRKGDTCDNINLYISRFVDVLLSTRSIDQSKTTIPDENTVAITEKSLNILLATDNKKRLNEEERLNEEGGANESGRTGEGKITDSRDENYFEFDNGGKFSLPKYTFDKILSKPVVSHMGGGRRMYIDNKNAYINLKALYRF
jgi:hypothetical protein